MGTPSNRAMASAAFLVAAISILQPPAAAAQDVATSFEQLQTLVKKGDVVVVTDASGRRTRGRLGELTASSLEILIPKTESDGRQTLVAQTPWPQANVASVVLERPDSLWNGTLIGLGIGAGIPLLSIQGCQSCSEPGIAYVVALITGGIGAGAGALVDVVRHQHVTVYQTPGQKSSRLQVVPILATSRTGVRMSVRF